MVRHGPETRVMGFLAAGPSLSPAVPLTSKDMNSFTIRNIFLGSEATVADSLALAKIFVNHL